MQGRRVTTHVEVVREGADAEGSDLFYSLLIDDPDDLADTPMPAVGQAAAPAAQPAGGGAGAASPSPTGVAQFAEHIKAEVFMQLQPQQ